MQQSRLVFLPVQHDDIIVTVVWRELAVLLAVPVALALAVWLLRRRGGRLE